MNIHFNGFWSIYPPTKYIGHICQLRRIIIISPSTSSNGEDISLETSSSARQIVIAAHSNIRVSTLQETGNYM